MLNIFYENSKGDKIYLTKNPYMMLSDTEIFNPEWQVKFQDKKYINNIYKECLDDSIQVRVNGSSYQEYLHNLDHLFEVVEYDMLSNNNGKLYFNDFYLTCRLYALKKPDKFLKVPFAIIELSICTDGEFKWNKITNYNINWQDYINQDIGKKYPYKYPYRYVPQNTHRTTIDLGVFGDVFPVLTIYGAVENPVIDINGTIYGARLTLREKEYLVIDSKQGQVYTVFNGKATNRFNLRYNNDMISKLPLNTETLDIYWNNNFNFDLKLITERGEPQYAD